MLNQLQRCHHQISDEILCPLVHTPYANILFTSTLCIDNQSDQFYLITTFSDLSRSCITVIARTMCYRGNVTKITQMVPEYSPQRGNPWKGFGPRGFLYSFLVVCCNTHRHTSCKNVTPTHFSRGK